MTSDLTAPKKKHPLADLLISIVIPSTILMKFSGADSLGPTKALLLALAFPIVYFLFELMVEKKTNFISILGIVSVLLTGGVGLFALDPKWIAIKEATIPAIIGLIVLISIKTPYPLVKKLLYNDQIIDTQRVAAALKEHQTESAFEKILLKTSYLLSASFFLSSVLNYVLAKIIVVTSPSLNQEAFNAEIGRMNMLSYPVIALPSTIMMGFALYILLHGLKKITGLDLETIFRVEKSEKAKKMPVDE